MPASNRFDLTGRTILLTGGAGKYGSALMQGIAEADAHLIVASRDREALQAAAAKCEGKISIETLDQSDENSILALLDRIQRTHKRLDGLVNNAVARPVKGLNGSAESWDESMAVNARGMMLMHRHFGGYFATQPNGGRIVNIGSIYGMVGPTISLYDDVDPNLIPDYYFHKAGLINLTRFYAAVFGKQNVLVNCVSAGGLFGNQDPAFIERYSQQTFLNRMAEGDELVGPVIFLLSKAASYVTGENLVVDGGFTSH